MQGWEEPFDGVAQQLLRFIAEEGTHLPIGEGNGACAIDDHDGVRSALEDRLNQVRRQHGTPGSHTDKAGPELKN